jgi:hypothetical protein
MGKRARSCIISGTFPSQSTSTLFTRPLAVSPAIFQLVSWLTLAERGRQQAISVIPEIQGWTSTSEARHACDQSILLLKVLSTPLTTHSLYYPTCTFVAILCVWAYVKWLPADEDTVASYETLQLIANFFHLTTDVNIPSTIKERQQLRDAVVPKKILEKGTRMLAHGKAWRIGAAFALVLAKQMEQESV